MPKPTKNINVYITEEELISQIDSMQDVNWSAVAKDGIKQYIERRQQPDLSVILSQLEQEKGQEYVNGRIKADEIILKIGYAQFNIMMQKFRDTYSSDVGNYMNGPPLEPWESAPDQYMMIKDILVSKKLIGDEVSLEYLKGLLGRFEALDKEFAKERRL